MAKCLECGGTVFCTFGAPWCVRCRFRCRPDYYPEPFGGTAVPDERKTQKPLIPLGAHNERVIAEHAKTAGPKPNGLACPNCGKELTDAEPGKVQKTNGPSYTTVACPHCGYTGIRYVTDAKAGGADRT